MSQRKGWSDYYWGLRHALGRSCPHCGPLPEEAVIYRLSHRSTTLRCQFCGLQWTVTHHQLVKMARRLAATAPPAEKDSWPFTFYRNLAATFAVEETRGRKPRNGPPGHDEKEEAAWISTS